MESNRLRIENVGQNRSSRTPAGRGTGTVK